jgi:hypothetical protein
MVHVYGTDDVIHVCDRYPHTEPIPTKNTCGEWEPAEGRVCSTCRWWMVEGEQDTMGGSRCFLDDYRHVGQIGVEDCNGAPTYRHGYDICDAWRWGRWEDD